MQPVRAGNGRAPGLPEGFFLRAVESDEDIHRYVELNQSVAGEGDIAARLLRSRPGSRRNDFFAVVERETEKVVSTTCLLRWQLSVEGVVLDAAMLEMVATDPAYRRHGLVRAQVEAFHRVASDAGADLFIIQGIPYYYRQFGYGYALDHTPLVELTELASVGERISNLRLRRASGADARTLTELYGIEMSRQGIHVVRSAEYWEYLLEETSRDFEILETPGTGEAVGYVQTQCDGERLMVGEAALRDPEDAVAALAVLGTRAPGRLLICGNRMHSLAHAAIDRGGTARVPGQWLLFIASPAAVLAKLGLVLERRLKMAGFAQAGGDLVINLYRRAVKLRIATGRIVEVKDVGFVDASTGAPGGDLCIPQDAFSRLLFGYRDLDQIRDAWPDTWVRPLARPILDALFPRVNSLILMPY
jgi:predicted N-acetyltransferase YhbS